MGHLGVESVLKLTDDHQFRFVHRSLPELSLALSICPSVPTVGVPVYPDKMLPLPLIRSVLLPLTLGVTVGGFIWRKSRQPTRPRVSPRKPSRSSSRSERFQRR